MELYTPQSCPLGCIANGRQAAEKLKLISSSSINLLGKDPATNSDEFLEKCQKGGGVTFNPKIYIADFGNFKQGYLSMKLIKRGVISGFKGMFFLQLY